MDECNSGPLSILRMCLKILAENVDVVGLVPQERGQWTDEHIVEVRIPQIAENVDVESFVPQERVQWNDKQIDLSRTDSNQVRLLLTQQTSFLPIPSPNLTKRFLSIDWQLSPSLAEQHDCSFLPLCPISFLEPEVSCLYMAWSPLMSSAIQFALLFITRISSIKI